MKKTLLLFLLLPFFGFAQTVDLVVWNGTNDLAPSAKSNYVISNNLTGAGLTTGPTPSNDGIIGTGWPTANTIDTGKYFQIEIGQILNGKFTLDEIKFTYKGDSKAFEVRYSKQLNFSSPTTLTTVTNAVSNNTPTAVTLSNLGIAVNGGEKVYVRFYAYNGGNWKLMNNDLLKIRGTINTVPSPLNGTYKIGSAADANFPTITSAVNALNALGVSGTVTFLLDNTLYNNTTNEVFPIKINSYGGGDTYKVTFRPNTGRTVVIESSTGFPQGIFKLDGADNIVFDGSNNATTSNNLTISNNNSSNNNRAVIWIASQNATNGANNNEIRNLTLQQYSKGSYDYSVGVFAGGTGDVSGSAPALAANSGNTVSNVIFSKVGQAVYVLGSSNTSLLSSNWTIQNNSIGSTINQEKPYVGVNLTNVKDYTVSGNKIDGIYRDASQQTTSRHAGIYSDGSVNGNVFNNSISNVVNTQGDATPESRGIYLVGSNTNIYSNTIANVSAAATSASGLYINGGNNTIYNNIISNVSIANNTAAHGIYLNAGDANKVYYNTIVMNNTTNSGNGSSCLYINNGTNIGIKNNIFYNSQTAATQFLINSAVAHTAITEFNNNNYYGTNASVKIGKLAANEYPTIALWKSALSASTKETNSLNIQPNFISATDFHLTQNNTNSGIHAKGIAISGITTDIDGDPRATPPDMGADEIFYCEQGDQITYGTDSWIGYVYKWTGTPAPTTYIGYVTENAIFDRNVGAGQVNGATRTICGTPPADNFMIRYLMKTTTVAGTYNFTVAGDDGYRLYIDGTLVNALSNWGDHSYTTNATQVNLTAGSHNFILEYYENAGASRTTFSYGLVKGDATVYGTNVWNVYGYTTANLNIPASSYAGTYVDSNLNFSTTNYWAKEQSPSAVAAWTGAPMPIDNFTISYKREGFPCGRYNIEVLNCDDDMRIYIDGTLVYTAGGNINAAVTIGGGPYPLKSDSKVEIRLREDAGDAKMAVNFNDVPVLYNGSGTPPTNSSIIITNDTTVNSSFEVCSCTINANKTLKILLDKVLTVKENITVAAGGKLLVENGGSLLQTNKNAVYTGAIDSFELQRATQAVRRYDYSYWSSPVTFASGFTLKKLSPNTESDKYYRYDPINGWTSIANGAATMTPALGYIVRSPETNSMTVGSVYTASFIGNPNNGDLNYTPVADKFNLIGNPYPSSLDAVEFIKKNNGNITGSLYFWTHNTLPANTDPAIATRYYYTSDDYAVFNLTGSVATSKEAPTDKSAANNAPTGNITSGQGFFVRTLNATPLKFTNEMRLGTANNQFFKTTANIEKGRLWLNFTNAQGAFKQTLVGYIDEATNSFDNNYDATSFNGNAYVDFYSVNDSKKLTIQGRALPFVTNDQVPLGYKSTIAGDFTISIDHAEGLLNDQPIYLEDKTTGKIHDLRTSNYNFTTEIGTFTERFVLRYTNKTLGTGDFENTEKDVFVSVKDKVIKINSSLDTIKEVSIFDISGRSVYNKKKVGTEELQIPNLQSSNQVLLIKVTLENDYTVTKKIIFN